MSQICAVDRHFVDHIASFGRYNMSLVRVSIFANLCVCVCVVSDCTCNGKELVSLCSNLSMDGGNE